MLSQDELRAQLAKIKQQQLLPDYSLDEDEVTKALLLRLSRYARSMEDLQRGGHAIISGGDAITTLSDSKQDIAQDFHWAALGMAAFNFFRIPSLYLYAYLLGHKLPWSWTNTVQWGYATFMLSLAIVCIFFPPIAPVAAFVLAGMALVNSTYFLIQAVFQRKALLQEKKKLEDEINVAEAEYEALKEEAVVLEMQMDKEYAQDPEAVTDKVTQLYARFLPHQQELQALHKKLAETEQMAEELGGKQLKERSLRVLLASLSVIGLVTSLFFPPVGLSILAGVALFSTAYFVLPFVYNKVQSLRKKELTPSSAPKENSQHAPAVVLEHHPSSTLKTQQELLNHSSAKKTDSTSKILNDDSSNTHTTPSLSLKIFSQSPASLVFSPPSSSPETEKKEERKHSFS